MLLQYICICLCARPKHTCSLSHNSIWSSPGAAEVAGSEQWWPQASPGWPGWLWCVTGHLEVMVDLCPRGVRGCGDLLCAAWALAPCPGRKENGRSQEILVLVGLITEPQAGSLSPSPSGPGASPWPRGNCLCHGAGAAAFHPSKSRFQ